MARDPVRGVDQAQRKLRRLQADMPRIAVKALFGAAAVVGEEAEKNAPRMEGDQSGEYRDSIPRSIRSVREPGKAAVRVGTDHPLADIFEHGGPVTPDNRDFLAFEAGGGWVRTKQVNMPAKAFMRPAADTKQRDASAMVRRIAGPAVIRSVQRG